mmetsp:Transcript_88322/g.254707  ORF Transcript_88322/g.254707 Transcript_88322/m.254707 type:complete len:199 (+) Transcript_88322:3-599(+)
MGEVVTVPRLIKEIAEIAERALEQQDPEDAHHSAEASPVGNAGSPTSNETSAAASPASKGVLAENASPASRATPGHAADKRSLSAFDTKASRTFTKEDSFDFACTAEQICQGMMFLLRQPNELIHELMLGSAQAMMVALAKVRKEERAMSILQHMMASPPGSPTIHHLFEGHTIFSHNGPEATEPQTPALSVCETAKV